MTSNGDSPRAGVDLRLAMTSRAPGVARDEAANWLDTLDVDPAVRRDVLVAVSELVTNAITHAAASPRVQLSAIDGQLRVEVHDSSAEEPVRKRGSATGGFGIQVVAALADSWGWAPTAGGKVVWAEFATEPASG